MGYTVERVCVVCGTAFTVDICANTRKCCSNACRDRHYAMQNEKLMNPTQEQLEGKHCLTCGCEISQPRGGHRRMYCSDHCSQQFRCYTSSEQQSKIQQQLRETQYTLKHGQQQPRGTRSAIQIYTCKCCGEEFVGEKSHRRVYCSQECRDQSHSYAGGEKQVSVEVFQLPPSSAAHEKAMAKHAQGMGAYAIAKALGCNASTVYGWLRTLKRRQSATSANRPFSEPYYRYIHARSAAEWLAILDDEMRCNGICVDTCADRTVVFFCGITKATTRLYALVEIAGALGQNPMDGRTYAFCNAERDYLVFFRWDGGGFQRTKRQRDYGRYVWPSEKIGEFIAVGAAEFAFILYGSQQKSELKKA